MNTKNVSERHLKLLKCPETSEAIEIEGLSYVKSKSRRKIATLNNIPLFAEQPENMDTQQQQAHYDKIADIYIKNLNYPHTLEYMKYLDEQFLSTMEAEKLGVAAEICCGTGEAFELVYERLDCGFGVVLSTNMLEQAREKHRDERLCFIQGDATNLPLADNAFDSVLMLGGIHHVPDRAALFFEISRVLKPGGRFYWREPVSDFWLWRMMRAVIYRLSPMLAHDSERPLLYEETVPVLEKNGLQVTSWKTCGFLGFCLLMNSDVLVFNRWFRFIPGIRMITHWFTRLDSITLRLPGMSRAGLQVVGVAQKVKTP